MTRLADRPAVVALATVGGGVLAATLVTAGLVRRDKPLHAYGATTHGSLRLDGAGATGSPVLDTAGEHRVLVRLSRASSVLPEGPDVMGLALRVPGGARDGGDADVLFASTFTSTPGRYVLAIRTAVDAGPLTTLLPQRSARGLVVLRLDPDGLGRYRLAASGAAGAWHDLGVLTLDEPHPHADEPVRFDPVGRPLAGLTPPSWVRALRDPAYTLARRLTPARAHRPAL